MYTATSVIKVLERNSPRSTKTGNSLARARTAVFALKAGPINSCTVLPRRTLARSEAMSAGSGSAPMKKYAYRGARASIEAIGTVTPTKGTGSVGKPEPGWAKPEGTGAGAGVAARLEPAQRPRRSKRSLQVADFIHELQCAQGAVGRGVRLSPARPGRNFLTFLESNSVHTRGTGKPSATLTQS